MRRMQDIKSVGSNTEELSLNSFDHSTSTSSVEIPWKTVVFKNRINPGTIKSFQEEQKMDLKRRPMYKIQNLKRLATYLFNVCVIPRSWIEMPEDLMGTLCKT